MAGIHPTSAVTPPTWPTPARGPGQGDPGAGKTDFADALRTYISKVDGEQQNSAAAVRDLLVGKSDDVLPVVSAVAKADLSFKLLLGIRNKVIEAYKQTVNMQV